ncbi:hypothetical protein STSP2_03152 [Anaerohalosphaera lusitana]|uniref:Transcriptional repressor NrdR-like N-terminal domain-containing protein n=1 Tax=Anaerohalosphaera lusitana TaxID=1936003 RepID=A0A1U9NPT7_9BACT|nr:hypothetical protein [Anaerohalosphaera lusitana]AQT69952.1 hypothetical protein STSP2_03152 [Anaerohalosphaera lusitana]
MLGRKKKDREGKEKKGIVCPKCGCADLRYADGRPWNVLKTVPGANSIRRRRVCRNCGKYVWTREVIEE